MRLRKLAIVAGAALPLVLTACGGGSDSDDSASSSGSSQQLTSMKVMMFPAVAYRLPVVVAEEKGLFAEHGVKIEIVPQPNNLQGVQALEATGSQAGQVSTTTLAQAFQAGSKVKLYCGGLPHVMSTMLAPADSDLPSIESGASAEQVLKSFEGKKIGVQTPVGSGFQMLLDAALKDAGVDTSKVTWVNVGGANQVTQAALQNGDVDVAQASPPGTQTLVENKVAKPLIYMPDNSEIYGDLYGSGWAGPADWLEKNPEAAKGFCDATAEALTYINDPANKDEVLALSMKDTGVTDKAVAEAVLETYKEYSADLPVESLAKSFAKYQELGITKPAPAVTTDALVDTVGR